MESQFLRAIGRSRQSTPSAINHRIEARKEAQRSEANTQATVRRETPDVQRLRANVASKKHKALLETLSFPVAAYATLSARVAYLAQPESRLAALLQSARLQALRAEIERCVSLALRHEGNVECSGEIRLILPPALFPDTTIVLRRQYDGWQLDSTVGDRESHDVLSDGAADLCHQFQRKGLGKLTVTVAVVANSDEPSGCYGEPTS
jgi:hypothetical protein